MKKLDTFLSGVLFGVLLPPITLYIIFLTMTKTMTFREFLSRLYNWDLATNIFIWTVLPLFFVFSFFYFKKYDNACKGIVLPTMIYTFILVILNF